MAGRVRGERPTGLPTPEEVWASADDDETHGDSPTMLDPDTLGNSGHSRRCGFTEGRLSGSCELVMLDGVAPVSSSPERGNLGLAVADAQAAAHAVSACVARLEHVWDSLGTESGHRSEVLGKLWQDLSAVLRRTAEQEEDRLRRAVDEITRLRQRALNMEKVLDSRAGRPSELESDCKAPIPRQTREISSYLQSLNALHAERVAMFQLVSRLYDELRSSTGDEAARHPDLPIPPPRELVHASDLTEELLATCCERVNEIARNMQSYLAKEEAGLRAECERMWAKSRGLQALQGPQYQASQVAFFESVDRTKAAGASDTVSLVTVETVRKFAGRPPESNLASAMCGLSHMTMAVAMLRDKRDELTREIHKHLRDQVVAAKRHLHELWDEYYAFSGDPDYCPKRLIGSHADPTLHIRDFPDDASDVNLALIEGECMQMSRKIEDGQQIVQLLKKRNRILQEKQALEEASQNKERLLSKSRNMAAILLQEEKARNGIKKLPEIERQLQSQCEEWYQRHGTPFTYLGHTMEECAAMDIEGLPVKTPPARTRSASTGVRQVTTPVQRRTAGGQAKQSAATPKPVSATARRPRGPSRFSA